MTNRWTPAAQVSRTGLPVLTGDKGDDVIGMT
jgi:hypothetical protein